jgi:hypothetical protein
VIPECASTVRQNGGHKSAVLFVPVNRYAMNPA